ncbi:MAG: DUF2520 domain-containing protein [Gammaproteobacteria bacterium]
MNKILRLNIIGAGKLGQTLGRLFQAHHSFQVTAVCNNSLQSSRQAVAFIGSGVACANLEDLPEAEVYLLAVPDQRIASLAAQLARIPTVSTARLAFHCSGALSSAELAPLQARGIAVASVHPCLTFATPLADLTALKGLFCAFEGEEIGYGILQPAMAALGAHLFKLSSQQKILYHAASAVACNYLVTVLDMALHLYQEAGLNTETAVHVIRPLVMQTIQNVLTLQPVSALTGPIARGDVATIQKHLQAIPDAASQHLYKTLGLATLNLAIQKQTLSAATVQEIKNLF